MCYRKLNSISVPIDKKFFQNKMFRVEKVFGAYGLPKIMWLSRPYGLPKILET